MLLMLMLMLMGGNYGCVVRIGLVSESRESPSRPSNKDSRNVQEDGGNNCVALRFVVAA